MSEERIYLHAATVRYEDGRLLRLGTSARPTKLRPPPPKDTRCHRRRRGHMDSWGGAEAAAARTGRERQRRSGHRRGGS